MKKILTMLLVLLLMVGCNKTNNKEEESETKIDDNKLIKVECDENHTCEVINDKAYFWSNIKNIKIDEMYNYENQELEVGNLVIKDGVLHFVDLNNNTIMKYDYIDGNVLYMEEVTQNCDDEVYTVLTDKGYIYKSDAHEGILVEESFYKLESEEFFTNVGVDYSESEEDCKIGNIVGKTKNKEVVDLLK